MGFHTDSIGFLCFEMLCFLGILIFDGEFSDEFMMCFEVMMSFGCSMLIC